MKQQNLPQGTLGMEEEDSPVDENGQVVDLDKEGSLPEATLLSLKQTKAE